MARNMFGLISLCIIFINIVDNNAMALDGPGLNRLNPCGLSAVQFNKMSGNQWKGILFLPKHHSRVVIEFGVQIRNVQVPETHHFSSFILRNEINNTEIQLDDDNNISYNKIILVLKDSRPHINEFDINFVEDIDPVVNQLTIDGEIVCDRNIKGSHTIQSFDKTNEYADKKFRHICGRRSMEHTELITTGPDSKIGDWPWHVAIFIKNARNPNKSFYQCGGSIISRTAILTAGHCISRNGIQTEAHRVIIVAGTTNLTIPFTNATQRFIAKEIILHPSYDDEKPTADLAVIKVDGFIFTEYVEPICIWGPVFDKTKLFGSRAMVVGFGKTENGSYSNLLRSTETMVQSDDTCIQFGPYLYPKLLDEFSFCAGYGPDSGVNPRNGDSGGGLVVPVTQPDLMISWFLRGVLSKCGLENGAVDCDPKFYVVYTDVGPHYSWIFKHAGLEFTNNIEDD